MRKAILLLALSLLLVIGGALAQPVTDVTFDEDILVNLTANQSAVAYNLELDAAATVVVDVRYLGAAFPFLLEVFDGGGSLAASATVDAPGGVSLDLPAGQHTLLLSAVPGNSGRAVLNLSLGEAVAAEGPPLSGEWQVIYGEVVVDGSPEFACEEQLTLDGVWLPPDGSTHTLTFGDEPQAFDFHRAVAPDEIRDAPEFFMTDVLPDGAFEVVPGLQGAPYVYVYAVNNPQHITLYYVETLNLSDCMLTLSAELVYVGPAADSPTQPGQPEQPEQPGAPVSGSVEGWTILGDAIEASPPGGDFLCGAPTSLGAFWLFDAPQSFVDQVVNGYGETLSFELRRRDAVQIPVTASITLVVGNGILLSYELPEPVTGDFTRYDVPLTETAGWIDVDGMFDTSDAGLFQQMLSDVTRVQIPGDLPDTDGLCLQNAAVGDGAPPVSDGDMVPYYVISPFDDVTGDGIPVGCDGYMIERSTGVAFSDDPAQNIRASLEALLAYGTTDVGEGDLTNYMGDQQVTIDSVSVDVNGHATVNFSGTLMLIGTCVDPQIEAQMLLGIFADSRVTSARINVNGENFAPMFDMSGMTGADAIYTRDDIRIRDW